MKHFYSTDTGERIATDNPADWMASTDVAPPSFDAATQGCFWRDGSWEVVTPGPIHLPVPSISPRQMRMALTRSGLRDAVETAVAGGPQDLKDWWEFGTSVERLNPEVVAMGLALGQTDEQLDALFTLGASL